MRTEGFRYHLRCRRVKRVALLAEGASVARGWALLRKATTRNTSYGFFEY